MRRTLTRTSALFAVVAQPLLWAVACGPAALSLGELGEDAGEDAADPGDAPDVEDAADRFVPPDAGIDTAAACTTTFAASEVDIGWVRAPACLLCLRTTCCENAGRCFDPDGEDAAPTCKKYGECLAGCSDAGDGGGCTSACTAFAEGGLTDWLQLANCARSACDACAIE